MVQGADPAGVELLEIVGLPFELRFTENTFLPLSRELRSFEKPGDPGGSRATRIELVDASFEGSSAEEHIGRRRRSISMAARGERYLFSYFTGQLLASRDFREVRLWSPREREMSMERDGHANYNGDPTLRLIVWGRASLEGFCYVHGALVVVEGRYILLMGGSGVGKSTLAGLVCDHGGTCLTDEDPFLSWSEGRPVVHGTPWPGIQGKPVPVEGGLSAIFFLRHARENELRDLDRQERSRRLLHHTRTFNWLPETIPRSIELLDRVARNVPAYDFGFVPDPSAVNAMRGVL